jgi:hypothetical protein
MVNALHERIEVFRLKDLDVAAIEVANDDIDAPAARVDVGDRSRCRVSSVRVAIGACYRRVRFS